MSYYTRSMLLFPKHRNWKWIAPIYLSEWWHERKKEKMKKKQFIADDFRTYFVNEITNILFFRRNFFVSRHSLCLYTSNNILGELKKKRFHGLNGPLWAMTNAFLFQAKTECLIVYKKQRKRFSVNLFHFSSFCLSKIQRKLILIYLFAESIM